MGLAALGGPWQPLATTDRVCNFYCFSMVLRDIAEATTDRGCNLYGFSMVLRDSAEATTDRVCIFYCFSMVYRDSAETTTDRVSNLQAAASAADPYSNRRLDVEMF